MDLRQQGALTHQQVVLALCTERVLAEEPSGEIRMTRVGDLGKVLAHYGYTFDDVIVENVFTTDMAKFLDNDAAPTEIYTNQCPYIGKAVAELPPMAEKHGILLEEVES